MLTDATGVLETKCPWYVVQIVKAQVVSSQQDDTETGRDGDAAKSIRERLSRRFSVSPLLRVIPLCLQPTGCLLQAVRCQLHFSMRHALCSLRFFFVPRT
jgi:hypothetical protein